MDRIRPSEGCDVGSIPAGGANRLAKASEKTLFLSKSTLDRRKKRGGGMFPVEMSLHKVSRKFEIAYDDGQRFELSFEFLRVFSPSAEVVGHTPDQAKLQVGKRDVVIDGVEAVGQYALRFTFSDGHDSGLYSWDYLYDLGQNQDKLWAAYLLELKQAGASRDPEDPANEPFKEKPKATCPSHR